MEALFEEMVINFLPGPDLRHCFVATWRDNSALEDSRNFTLLLSSGDEGVITQDAVLQIQNDDSKK